MEDHKQPRCTKRPNLISIIPKAATQPTLLALTCQKTGEEASPLEAVPAASM